MRPEIDDSTRLAKMIALVRGGDSVRSAALKSAGADPKAASRLRRKYRELTQRMTYSYSSRIKFRAAEWRRLTSVAHDARLSPTEWIRRATLQALGVERGQPESEAARVAEMRSRAVTMRADKIPVSTIAETLGVSRSRVYQLLQEAKSLK